VCESVVGVSELRGIECIQESFVWLDGEVDVEGVSVSSMGPVSCWM
jgi:hypothetical protein